jgi:hypothetical protein
MDSQRRTRLSQEELNALMIEYGGKADEAFLLELCEQLLVLLDDPVRYSESLQILHGIWYLGNWVRSCYDQREIPAQLIQKNQEVTNKASLNKDKLREAIKNWDR